LAAALYELPKRWLLRGGFPWGVVDLFVFVRYEGGGTVGVVEGAFEEKKEGLEREVRAGVAGDLAVDLEGRKL